MARGTVTRAVPSSAAALGMVRAGVHGVFLVSILATSFSALGRLPVTVLRPTGLMQIFSWGFYDALLTPAGMLALKLLLVTSLLAGTLGYLTPLTTKASALLVLFYEGLVRSFGHFNHDEMVGVYFLIVLAASPCGDAFSLDSLPRPGRRRRAPGLVYGYPVMLMWALMAWVYFSSALIKLRVSGLVYFSPDTLPTLAIFHSLGNLHDTDFRAAFGLPALRSYLPFAVFLVVAWELLFPLAIWRKPTRRAFLCFGILFHLATMFTMNIFFPHQLALYLVFVDWPSAARRLTHLRPLRRVSACWRDFSRVPEDYAGAQMRGVTARGLLLWDGDCGFCRRWVGRLQRFARRPFEECPYQELAGAGLPDEVLRWSGRQMHWVDARGRVTGGSQALIELLWASGHGFVAALLESKPCRPFTWAGYHLVAYNRGRLGRGGESQSGRMGAVP